ncbi:hypothetical protein F5Y09DRAFT_36398 [Xylaria sp. FL1042]|nr:hypothetical protein F5Y09DRAFT_36398 [Xylaria sp. FL1042]
MPALLLRAHLKVARGLSRRSHTCRNPQRRHQSSSTSSSSPSPSPTKPAPENESLAQAQAHVNPPPPHVTQQVPALSRPVVPIPVPSIVPPPPPPFWQRLGPLMRAAEAYGRAQRARPWVTQVASTLVVYLCADLGAQWISRSGQDDITHDVKGEGKGGDGAAKGEGRKHDWARTARSLVIGGTAAIPGYIWFSFLSRSFNYSSKVLSISIKVVVNQLVFTPLFNVYFFGAQALLSGDTPAEAWRRVCNTVPVSFVNSCKLWPAVTAFNFAFVPFEYRSIFGGVIAVGWQTYLSFLNRRAERLEALRQRGQQHTSTVTGNNSSVLDAAPGQIRAGVAAVRSVQELELPAGKQAIHS